MKTKTNSFTKVINFCVLALFLITNMIFFTSCDNGNSPNDNINQQQNNNSQTDYCEICDGLQTENCGIKHKCDDENCIEYSDNRIYKNGHTHDYCNEDGCLLDESVKHTTHDYCERTDCDGSTHKGQAHPEYESWFKKTQIGENIDVKCVDINAVPGTNAKERFENIFNQYRTHIEGFTLNEQLTNVNFDLANANEFDQLIGTTDISKENMCPYNGINDVCAPAIEEIINNVGSGDTAARDKAYFALYYRAIANECYRNGYNGELTTKNQDGKYDTATQNQMQNQYNQEKNKCISLYGSDDNLPFDNKYFYDENGNINPEVVEQFDKMITNAATKLKEQGKQVEVVDLRNIINLSFTASTIQGTHDSTLSWTYTDENNQLQNAHHTSFNIGDANCPINEMVNKTDAIGFPQIGKMTQQAKLNKSVCGYII